jgi:hypothetical protein
MDLKWVNHQNPFFGISIIPQENAKDLPTTFEAAFKPAYGLNGMFKCSRIEVVEESHAQKVVKSTDNPTKQLSRPIE